MLKILQIFILLFIVVIVGYLGNEYFTSSTIESFNYPTSCAYCNGLDERDCASCGNCTWQISADGSGQCVTKTYFPYYGYGWNNLFYPYYYNYYPGYFNLNNFGGFGGFGGFGFGDNGGFGGKGGSGNQGPGGPGNHGPGGPGNHGPGCPGNHGPGGPGNHPGGHSSSNGHGNSGGHTGR